jgi:type IV secretory pathway TrbD component
MASTPTFQSLTRPLLVAGGERVPMAIVGLFVLLPACGAWFGWSLVALATAAFMATAGVGFLRFMAKRDPQMFEIAGRFYAFRRFYPARAPAKRFLWDIIIGMVAVLKGGR